MQKTKTIWKKRISIINLTIQQIAIAGVMLGVITVAKLLDNFIPQTQLGVAWIELYVLFAVVMILILPFKISLVVLISAPFLWFVIGQTTQMSPLSFFLDYSLPLLSLLTIYLAKFNFFKKKYLKEFMIITTTIIAFVVKWFCHTVSGVVSYKTPWQLSAILNSPYVFATLGVTIVGVLLIMPKINVIRLYVNDQGSRW